MRAFKAFFLSNDLDQLSFGGQDGQFSQGTGTKLPVFITMVV